MEVIVMKLWEAKEWGAGILATVTIMDQGTSEHIKEAGR